jgi:hypothetical protein
MSGSTQRLPNNFKSGNGQFVCQVEISLSGSGA